MRTRRSIPFKQYICDSNHITTSRRLYANTIEDTVEGLLNGNLSKSEAIRLMKNSSLGINQLSNFAKLDMTREKRSGFPEVVFASGKSAEHLADIMKSMYNNSRSSDGDGPPIIATRVSLEQFEVLKQCLGEKIEYVPSCRIAFTTKPKILIKIPGSVAVMCAGTSDYAVAEEAAVILELSGVEKIVRLYDVGVAGIHRLLVNIDQVAECEIVIVCAGMDGALPSAVGGLVRAPVISVPTSVGYGASFGGISAMLTMLNSCAPGVSVVNNDNRFGAAVCALKMLKCFESRGFSNDPTSHI